VRQRFLLVMSAVLLLSGWGASRPLCAEPKPAKPAAVKAAPANAAKNSAKKSSKNAAKVGPISADREQELLQFVHEHHPELAELLDQLKPMNSAQYQAALKDLDRDVRRLEMVRKRGTSQSDVELNLWKSRSRIRLLAARLTTSADDELRSQLRAELQTLRKLELEVAQLDITATQQNLEKQQRKLKQLERRVSALQGDADTWVDRKLAELERAHQPADNAKSSKATAETADSEQPAKVKSKPKVATQKKLDPAAPDTKSSDSDSRETVEN